MEAYFSLSYMIKSFPILLSYVHVAILIAVVAAVLGTILGAFIALGRVNKVPVLNQILIVFISFMRGTPYLVQLFLVYFGVPEILGHVGVNVRGLPGLIYVYAVFTLHIAAYSGEILRASIGQVGQGEKEAAKALGMTDFQAYRRIVFPQAFRLSIPPLTNVVISMIKGTALIFNVGVVDMMRKAELLGGNSQRYLELFVDAAIIYGILIFIISLLGRFLEKRLSLTQERPEQVLVSED